MAAVSHWQNRSRDNAGSQHLTLCICLALLGIVAFAPAAGAPTVNVFAAASLTDALNTAIERYEAHHDVDIVPVYGSSSTMARQIANGAPAHLYLSANERWMDWLSQQGIKLGARADLLRNRLALIAPSTGGAQSYDPESGQTLSALLNDGERLALGDPDHVPAGIYAKQALQSLGDWDTLEPRLARADNVRAALTLVERGEAPLGIVYTTDVGASDKVRQLGLLPADSHNVITYPVALIGSSVPDAAVAFREWLDSDESMAIFTAFGFAPGDAR